MDLPTFVLGAQDTTYLLAERSQDVPLQPPLDADEATIKESAFSPGLVPESNHEVARLVPSCTTYRCLHGR